MKRILAFLLICALEFTPTWAWAATYYISNCGTGSLSGQCTNGATGNNGTSTATPKQTVGDWFTLFNTTVSCGDTILFARGGAWTAIGNSGGRLEHPGCSASTPITVGAYTPSSITYPGPYTGNATAQTNTTVTDSGAAFPTASGGLAGYGIELTDWLGAQSYHLIASNTATAITLASGELVPYSYDPIVATAPYRVVPPRPKLQDTTNTALNFTESSGIPGTLDGFYIFNDLHLIGNPAAGQNGFFWNRSAHDITIQRVRIERFGVGIFCGDSESRPPPNDSLVTGLKVSYSYIYNNGQQGTLCGTNDQLWEFNIFDMNAAGGGTGDHNVYVGANNITFRKNTFLRNTQVGGVCIASSFVMHGKHDGLTLEGNLFYQPLSTQGGGCYGIDVSAQYDFSPTYGMERFRDVRIDGNTLVNMGGIGIGVSAAIAPIIQNNVIVYEQTCANSCGNWPIMVPNANYESGDAAPTGAKILYNSIYIAGASSDTFGISLGFNYTPTTGNNGMQIVGNGIYFAGGVDSTRYCFDFAALTLTNFAAFDYNGCYLNGAGRYSRSGNTVNLANLAAAQAAGFDVHGLGSDPQFTAPSKATRWRPVLGGASPWKLQGSPSINPLYYMDGKTRPTPSNMGALQ